jgi:hypothetical protein
MLLSERQVLLLAKPLASFVEEHQISELIEILSKHVHVQSLPVRIRSDMLMSLGILYSRLEDEVKHQEVMKEWIAMQNEVHAKMWKRFIEQGPPRGWESLLDNAFLPNRDRGNE